MIHRVSYTIYMPTSAVPPARYVDEVEDTTWARAVGQVVVGLEEELEAGDVYNYRVDGLGGPIWGWEPDEDETVCV